MIFSPNLLRIPQRQHGPLVRSRPCRGSTLPDVFCYSCSVRVLVSSELQNDRLAFRNPQFVVQTKKSMNMKMNELTVIFFQIQICPCVCEIERFNQQRLLFFMWKWIICNFICRCPLMRTNVAPPVYSDSQLCNGCNPIRTFGLYFVYTNTRRSEIN